MKKVAAIVAISFFPGLAFSQDQSDTLTPNAVESEPPQDDRVKSTKKKSKVKKKIKDAKSGKKTKTSNDMVSKRSSRMNRADKKIAVGADAGLIFSGTPGAGLELSFNSSDSLQIGGGFSYGKEDLRSDAANEGSGSSGSTSTQPVSTIETEELDLSFTYVNASAKYFLGNSFFFSAGFGYRIIETNIRVASKIDSMFIDTNTKSSSFCLDIGLGNRWTFDSGLYIGGNWFAAVLPVSSSYSATTSASGSATEKINEISEDNTELAKKIGSAVHYRLAAFQIGFNF